MDVPALEDRTYPSPDFLYHSAIHRVSNACPDWWVLIFTLPMDTNSNISWKDPHKHPRNSYFKVLWYLWSITQQNFCPLLPHSPVHAASFHLGHSWHLMDMVPWGQCPRCHSFPLTFSACPVGVHCLDDAWTMGTDATSKPNRPNSPKVLKLTRPYPGTDK